MIKFDYKYIGNQHWQFHMVGGAHGLRIAILSVKGTKNEGAPLAFFEVRHMKCLSSLHSIPRRTMVHIPFNFVVCGIFVKVEPWCSLLPMSMVDLVNVNPWDLCIVNAPSIMKGVCFLLLRFMGGIGMCFGWDWSHGNPMQLTNAMTT